MNDVAQNTEYHLEALWTAIKQARAVADAAIAQHEAARSKEVAANAAKYQAEKERDVLQSALVEVLAGRARVEWRDDARRFVVTWLDASKSEPLMIPPAAGQHEQRTPPPPNAAHVGSSVQGQVSR